MRRPKITRSVLSGILATGDVLGRDEQSRIVLAVAVDEWLFDEVAAPDCDLADLEAEADEDDDPAKDEKGW